MKFEYDDVDDKGECVAYAHIMRDCGDETTSIAIKIEDGKVCTFYHDGNVLIQHCYENDLGKDLIRKFYKGDKIAITF